MGDTKATPTYVQVAPDSTGQKVRNLSLTQLRADGTSDTVVMQVTSIADEYGNVLDFKVANKDLIDAIERLRESIDFMTKMWAQ